MKKSTLTALFIAAALPSMAVHAQEINESSRFIELGIGVGASEGTGKTLGMFTQRLAAEWIVKDNIFHIADKPFALGVGFQIDNAAGGRYSSIVDGKYDYKYSYTIRKETETHGRPSWKTETHHDTRKGVGFASADVIRDNISLMPTVSLHGKFFRNIDVYATFGLGLGIQTYSLGNYETVDRVAGIGPIQSFESKDFSHESEVNGKTWIWSGGYNDIDHAEWNKKPYKAKAGFACAFYLGARYFLNSNWAVNAQFGLISANVRRSCNSYNLLSVGATYSF